jgi:hypothetical protein
VGDLYQLFKRQRIIITIVPHLPPAIDGVGDYGLTLARQLRQDHDIHTQFVIGDPSWVGETQIEGFPIHRLRERSAKALDTALADSHCTTVLLHYVGYGYARRGCPAWLVEGLRRWRGLTSNRRLVTMFHELYASSTKPWTSAFWLSSLQRNLAAGLATLSEHCFTSRESSASLLTGLCQRQQNQISVMPVFSNIGEPGQVSPLADLARRLVVFGHRNSRAQVYQECLEALLYVCKALEIEEIYDIGVPTGLPLFQLTPIPIVEIGVAQATEISSILKESIVGFINFPPPEYLAKSGIFAAYCAHQLLPVLSSATTRSIDGLRAGEHYWAANGNAKSLDLTTAQIIAESAHQWYQTHNLPVQAKTFALHLKNLTN